MDKELKVVAFQENLGGVEGSTEAVLSAKELVQVCVCTCEGRRAAFQVLFLCRRIPVRVWLHLKNRWCRTSCVH